MNKQRLQALKEHLASVPEENVNMDHYIGHFDGFGDETDWDTPLMCLVEDLRLLKCDTAGCIAGHTVALFGTEGISEEALLSCRTGSIEPAAQRILDLSPKQTLELFFFHSSGTVDCIKDELAEIIPDFYEKCDTAIFSGSELVQVIEFLEKKWEAGQEVSV